MLRLARLLLENQGYDEFGEAKEAVLPQFARDDARRIFLKRLARLAGCEELRENDQEILQV